MSQLDFLCLPSVNGEISIEFSELPSAIPEEWRGRKVTVEKILPLRRGREAQFEITLNGYCFEIGCDPHLTVGLAGSAINDAVGLSRLGSRVALCGAVGQDNLGEQVGHYAERNGIVDMCFVRSGETALTLALIEAETRCSTLLCYKPSYQVPSLAVLNRLRKIQARYIVATGVRQTETGLVERLFLERPESVRVFVPNSELCQSPIPNEVSSILSKTDILQVNEEEARMLLGRQQISAEEAVEELSLLGPKIAIVTKGDRGSAAAAFHNGRNEVVIQDALKAQVNDPTGAGDAFLCGFLAAHFRQYSHQECLRIGSWVAARNIEHIGGHGGMPIAAQLQIELRGI